MTLNLCNEEVQLLAEKAFYWPREGLLVFSDVHIGKAESLQSQGIPLPSGSHLEDLYKIERLIQKTQPKKVFILGDFIHQKNSWAPHIISDLEIFFNRHQNISWSLAIGNHEKGSLSYLSKLPIELIENGVLIEPFFFSHGHLTTKKEGPFEIRGHLHPAVRVKEGSIQLRLPCFVLERQRLTLPSFGILTGAAEVKKTKQNRLFAVTEETLFEVSY